MMKDNGPTVNGYTDSRGEWRPENPVTFAPIFVWPPQLNRFLSWLYNYLFTWNLVYLAVVIFSYYYLQPPLEELKTFNISWILTLFIRNMALVWIVYGGWHLYLYKFKARGTNAKYSPRWQSTNGSTFLWNDQVYDNIFWACASAVPIWTAYEAFTFWLYANGKLPYIDFKEHPVYFVLLFMLIPFWREFHFYLIHRLIHWKPLYNKIHYLHHYNINPGPWSGLAMHPIEHLLYFSVVLIHYIVPSHPLHFLFNSQHTALTPAPSHSGFEGKLFRYLPFGSYFHYLHHRLFECNYGESTIPMDKWFGVFEDGSQTQTEKQTAAAAYHKLVVTKITDESPEVKSIYLKNSDHTTIKKHSAGQYFTFRIPFLDNKLTLGAGNETNTNIKYAVRSYTITSANEKNEYRVSIKKEKEGQVSSALHESLKVGDILEARGPRGSFVLQPTMGKPTVLIAAGIGITPILSMLNALTETDGEVYLFLAAKDNHLLCFKEEIAQFCKSNRNVAVHVYFSQPDVKHENELHQLWTYHNQRIDIESIKEVLPNDKNYNFYICTPKNMMDLLVKEITNWKGANSPIYKETFGTNKKIERVIEPKKAIHVYFSKSNKTIEWQPDFKNILEFAESNDIRMEAGCMFGECGACSTKLVDGTVDYNYETATKPANGNCLPCSCRPSSDITIDA